jgi:hypothetical protein
MSSSGAMSGVGVFRKQNEVDLTYHRERNRYIEVESFVNHHTKQDIYDDLKTGKESSTVDGNWIDKADIVSSGIALILCAVLGRNLHKVQQHVLGDTRPFAFLHQYSHLVVYPAGEVLTSSFGPIQPKPRDMTYLSVIPQLHFKWGRIYRVYPSLHYSFRVIARGSGLSGRLQQQRRSCNDDANIW